MNSFDKIAQKASSTDAPKNGKVAALVNEAIQKNVDDFVANKAEIKRLEAEQKTIEETIIGHVRPQQDELAYAGSFTKSLEVVGKTARVLYSTQDRFSVAQDSDAQSELKKLVGKRYHEMFTVKRTIIIKDAALKDETLLNKIAAVCEKSGLSIADIFEVGDKVVALSDLDRKQYDLTAKQLATFRTIVRQAKPALK